MKKQLSILIFLLASLPIFGQVRETAIEDGSILARLADNETVTGNWTFTGTTTLGALTLSGRLTIALDAGTPPSVSSNTALLAYQNATTGADAYITVLSGNAANARLQFGDTDSETVGWIEYDHGNNELNIRVNGTDNALLVSSTAQLGVNEPNPGAQLHVTVGNAARVGAIVEANASQTANLFEANSSGGSGGDLFEIQANGTVSAAGYQISGTSIFATTNTWTADQTFADNVKATFGTGGDADVWYDGADMQIDPQVVGSGDLLLAPNGGIVAVGHSSPNAGSVLDAGSAGAQTKVYISNTATDGDPMLTFLLPGVKGWTMGVDDGDGDKFKISDTDGFGQVDVTIDTNGAVGIGTANPDNPLEVVGSAKISSTAPRLDLEDTDISGVHRISAANAQFVINADPGNVDAGTNIGFYVDGSEKVRIDSSGQFGIGTAAPGTDLHIQESTTDTTPTVEIEQTSTGDAALQFSIVGDAYALGIDNSSTDKFKLSYASSAGSAVLGTNTLLEVQGSPPAFDPTFLFEAAASNTAVATFNAPSSSSTGNTYWAYNDTSQIAILTQSNQAYIWLLNIDYGSGNSGPELRIGRNSYTSPSSGSLRFTDKGGTNYYLWVDDSGDFRINTSGPTNGTDTSGTVVGDQTSTRDLKNVYGKGVSPEAALDAILGTNVYEFSYKNGRYNGEHFQGVVIDTGDEWYAKDNGKSLNDINAIGYLVQAFKALEDKVERLEKQQ